MTCCPKATVLLAKLGCPTAARMHAEGATVATPGEWLAHFDEEERHLFPLLEPWEPAAVRAMREDHAVFARELAIHNRIISHQRLREHSALEDRLVAAYFP